MPATGEAQPALSLAEAIALLPDSEAVHTWKNDGLGVRPGWLAKEAVVALMERHGVKRANPGAMRLSHGLRIDTPAGVIFVQTRKAP